MTSALYKDLGQVIGDYNNNGVPDYLETMSGGATPNKIYSYKVVQDTWTTLYNVDGTGSSTSSALYGTITSTTYSSKTHVSSFTSSSGVSGSGDVLYASWTGTTMQTVAMELTVLTEDAVTPAIEPSGTVPGANVVLIDPGSPAVPGYFSTEKELVCEFVSAEPTSFEPGQVYLPPDSGPGSPGGAARVCSVQDVQVWHEPVPARAPTYSNVDSPSVKFARDLNLGWSDGARSVARPKRDAFLQFTVGSTLIGAVVGFEDTANLDSSIDATLLAYAYPSDDWSTYTLDPAPITDESFMWTYIRNGVVIRDGELFTFERFGSQNYLSTIATGDVVRVERNLRRMRWYKNGTLLKESLLERSYRPTSMVAMLYAGGDYIDTPSVGDLLVNQAYVYVSPLEALGGAAIAQAGVFMQFMTVSAGAYPVISLPHLSVFAADHVSGQASLSLPYLAVTAHNTAVSITPRFAIATVGLPTMQAAAVGTTGGTGQASVSTKKIVALGWDHVGGMAAVDTPTLYAFGLEEGNGNATIGGLLTVTPSLTAYSAIVVTMTSTGTITNAVAYQVVKDASATTGIGAATTWSSTSILQALLSNVLSIGSAVPVYEQPTQAWVVNIDSGASTSYESYDFNSYAIFDGHYLGVKNDGLYLLEGDDDDGTPIRASISLGKQNFDTSLLKRPQYCYVGVSSSGTVFMKVTDASGTEYVYAARRADQQLATQRFDLGKGLRANYFTFELFNGDGADFEFNTVEFQLAELTRRI